MDKRKKTFADITADIIVIIMVLLLCSILFYKFTDKILIGKLEIENSFTNAVIGKKESGLPEGVSSPPHVGIDWSKWYRFPENEDEKNGAGDNKNIQEEKKSSVFDNIKEQYDTLTKKKEKFTANLPDNLIFPDFYNKAGSFISRKILMWEVPETSGDNRIVTLGDGCFSGIIRQHDADKSTENLKKLKDFLEERDTELLYVAAPRKITAQDKYVSGTVDFSVQNTDSLISQMKDEEIDYIDMRAVIAENYENPHDAFFKTDLHWKPETARLASYTAAKYLNDNFGFGIDLSLLEKDAFEYEVYENRLLGSEGRKLTTSVAAPEDMELAYSKSDISFHIVIPTRDIDKTGGCEVFYDYSQVLGNIEYYDRMAYEAYMYSGNALTQIDNLSNPDGKKILLLCDSFGRTFTPFFSVGVGHLDVIDLRQFSGCLASFIDINGEYDAVVIVYNAGAIDSELFNFKLG